MRPTSHRVAAIFAVGIVCYAGMVFIRVCDVLSCTTWMSRPETNHPASNLSPRTHVVTFATPIYRGSANRLLMSAETAHVKRIYDFSDVDDDFKTQNTEILALPTGAGQYVWKPYVVLRHLVYEAEEGDVVVYCDSLFSFTNLTLHRVSADLARGVDVVVYGNKPGEHSHLEVKMTKGDAYVATGMSPQKGVVAPWAGFVAFRRSMQSIRFVSEWLTWSRDMRVGAGTPSVTPNEDEFEDARYDQTALSLLVRKWNLRLGEIRPTEMNNHHHNLLTLRKRSSYG
jgi:hypothetical protein